MHALESRLDAACSARANRIARSIRHHGIDPAAQIVGNRKELAQGIGSGRHQRHFERKLDFVAERLRGQDMEDGRRNAGHVPLISIAFLHEAASLGRSVELFLSDVLGGHELNAQALVKGLNDALDALGPLNHFVGVGRFGFALEFDCELLGMNHEFRSRRLIDAARTIGKQHRKINLRAFGHAVGTVVPQAADLVEALNAHEILQKRFGLNVGNALLEQANIKRTIKRRDVDHGFYRRIHFRLAALNGRRAQGILGHNRLRNGFSRLLNRHRNGFFERLSGNRSSSSRRNLRIFISSRKYRHRLLVNGCIVGKGARIAFVALSFLAKSAANFFRVLVFLMLEVPDDTNDNRNENSYVQGFNIRHAPDSVNV